MTYTSSTYESIKQTLSGTLERTKMYGRSLKVSKLKSKLIKTVNKTYYDIGCLVNFLVYLYYK